METYKEALEYLLEITEQAYNDCTVGWWDGAGSELATRIRLRGRIDEIKSFLENTSEGE